MILILLSWKVAIIKLRASSLAAVVNLYSRQMWFSDASTPAHRISEVTESALPVGRAARYGRHGSDRWRRQRLRWRWRRDRGIFDRQFGRVSVAGNQRLDHLNDFLIVYRRVRIERRGWLRITANGHLRRVADVRGGRTRCRRSYCRVRIRRYRRRRVTRVCIVRYVSVLSARTKIIKYYIKPLL